MITTPPDATGPRRPTHAPTDHALSAGMSVPHKDSDPFQSALIGSRFRYHDAMATVTRTYLIDDLDSSEDEVETVHFALDGAQYEIDLNPENATRLRERMERFIEAGHRVKEQKRSKQVITTGTVSKEQTQAIRHWAKENGYEVSERGRIAANIREAFEAAH